MPRSNSCLRTTRPTSCRFTPDPGQATTTCPFRQAWPGPRKSQERDETMKAEDTKNLKIAIVGAGYGGAAAAKALILLGADVSVYEQASRMREVGAGIGLRPATMHRFSQWGIFDTIANVSSPSDYFEILTATGEPIMKDTWPEFGAEKQTYLIHRRDFIEALLGVLPEGMV